MSAGIGAGVGALLGLLKTGQEQRQRDELLKIESTKERFSPWTGRHGNTPQQVDGMGNVMQGAVGGAQFGQQFGGSPAAPGAPSQPASQQMAMVGTTQRQQSPYTGKPQMHNPWGGSPGGYGSDFNYG